MQDQSQNAPLVVISDHRAVTTSKAIADCFGKRHDDVLKAIRALIDDLPPEHARNFAETVIERENPSGGAPIKSPVYEMTRDGFTLLAMGFTGKKALTFKLAYIDAFNRMEAALKSVAPLPVEHILNTTIGTDGFHVLAALIAGKVSKLPPVERRSVVGEIWAQVHKAFGVSRAEDIPAASLDSARNFVGAYVAQARQALPAAPARAEFSMALCDPAQTAFHADVVEAIGRRAWALTALAHTRIVRRLNDVVKFCPGAGADAAAAVARLERVNLDDALQLAPSELSMLTGSVGIVLQAAKDYEAAVNRSIGLLHAHGVVVGVPGK